MKLLSYDHWFEARNFWNHMPQICDKCYEAYDKDEAYEGTEFHNSPSNPKFVEIYNCPHCGLKNYVGVK